MYYYFTPFFTIYNYYYIWPDNVWSDLNSLSLSLIPKTMPLHAYILMTLRIFFSIMNIITGDFLSTKHHIYQAPASKKINSDITHILIYPHIYNIQWNT